VKCSDIAAKRLIFGEISFSGYIFRLPFRVHLIPVGVHPSLLGIVIPILGLAAF